MKRIQCIVFSSCLFLASALSGQKLPKNTFAALSSDRLYENGVLYLMTRSPLTPFPEYKKVFPEVPLCEISYASVGYGPLIQDKNYVAEWKLVNDTLYLSDVTFLVEGWEQLDRKEAYARIATLVHGQFDRLNSASDVAPVSTEGVIYASWFTDTLYVKKARLATPLELSSEETSGPAWLSAPHERLVFRNGILVNRDLISKKRSGITRSVNKASEKKVKLKPVYSQQ